MIKKNFFFYLDNMQKYFISDNYIKYKGEPILGIFNSPLISRYLIKNIREYFLQKDSEKIFIIFISNKKQNMKYYKLPFFGNWIRKQFESIIFL